VYFNLRLRRGSAKFCHQFLDAFSFRWQSALQHGNMQGLEKLLAPSSKAKRWISSRCFLN